jgi:hypothetical protein
MNAYAPGTAPDVAGQIGAYVFVALLLLFACWRIRVYYRAEARSARKRDRERRAEAARKAQAARTAEREMFATWCPELVKVAVSGSNAKIEPCEHLTPALIAQAMGIAKRGGVGRKDYRIHYIKRLIDHHGLPGAVSKGGGGGSSDEPTMTKRQSQHAWYGDNNQDLNWRDRERAEMYGMDVDTYRNNVKEAD